MSITLSALKQDLFRVIDQVIRTGESIEIDRNGHIVKIILDDTPEHTLLPNGNSARKKSKIDSLEKHDCIVGDPDDLVNISLNEWTEDNNL